MRIVFALVAVALLANADSTQAATPKKPSKKAAAKTVQAPASQTPSTVTPEVTPPAPTAAAPEAPAAANTSAAPSFSQGWQNVRMSYVTEWFGPTLENIDGKPDGPQGHSGTNSDYGTGWNVSWNHFLSLGYKFHPFWTFSVAQSVSTPIGTSPKKVDADKSKGKKREKVVWGDPYVTLSTSAISSPENDFAMPLYFRYYIPTSNSSARSVGTMIDQYYGRFRINAVPTFTKGNWEFLSLLRFQYYFPGEINKYAVKRFANDQFTATRLPRRDFHLIAQPQIGYTWKEGKQVYVFWGTGTIWHNREGGFTRLNDPDDGQSFGLGFNLAVSKRVELNPEISVGSTLEVDQDNGVNRRTYNLKTAGLYLAASVSLLP